MSDKKQALIEVAKSGNISDMYRLISGGAEPFFFDQNGKNAFDYVVESDPIKARILLSDLEKIYTSYSKQLILRHYTALAIKAGGDDEE